MPVMILKVGFNRHTGQKTSAEIIGSSSISEGDYKKRLITTITGMPIEDSVKAFLKYIKDEEANTGGIQGIESAG